MPRYSVRLYSSYVDEYEVEAQDADEALALAEEYQYVVDMPEPGELEKLAAKVEQVTKHAYVDSEDPCISALDADGNWLDA